MVKVLVKAKRDFPIPGDDPSAVVRVVAGQEFEVDSKRVDGLLALDKIYPVKPKKQRTKAATAKAENVEPPQLESVQFPQQPPADPANPKE